MVIFLVALLVFCLIGIRIRKSPETNAQFLDVKTTSSICGIFVVIVFCSHITNYFDCTNMWDRPMEGLCHSLLGQLMVVPFFVFGAFGIIQQYLRKGNIYLKNFPIQRFLKVILMWLFCVGIRALVQLVSYSGSNNYLTIESVFQFSRDWFIYAILIEYTVIYLSLVIFKEKKTWILVFSVLATLVVMFIFGYFKMQSYWYNTLLAFPFGVSVGLYKDEIYSFLMKNNKRALILMILVFAIFVGVFVVNWKISYNSSLLSIGVYSLLTLAFSSLLIFFSYFLVFGNKILMILYKYTIWVYLLQWPVFELFSTKLDLLSIHKYLFVFCSLILVGFLSFGSKYLFDLFDKFCLKRLIFKEKIKTEVIKNEKI